MSNSRRWREFLQWWKDIKIDGLSTGELVDIIDEKIEDIKYEHKRRVN